ncbi:MAG: hypothetical protein OHK0017_11090 [Patescibacteria group bacterium]
MTNNMTNRQYIVLGFGIVFVLIGLLGFVQNPVLGVFGVDNWHNFIHLFSGIAALAVFRSDKNSTRYAKVMGIIYAAVFVLGVVWPNDKILGFIHIENNDDWLHLFLAAILLYTGYGLRSKVVSDKDDKDNKENPVLS